MSRNRTAAAVAAGFLALLAALALISATVQAAPHTKPQTRPINQPAIDWSAVEQALGKPGQMMPGDVFRIGMPRSDLTVSVKGVPVKPSLALGSYAAFPPMGDGAMVMGDLVLLDEEVSPVMVGLFARGFSVTGIHNHLNEMTPHVMYLHYSGHGDPVQLATGLHEALSASATPL